jgi:hypothetical protein
MGLTEHVQGYFDKLHYNGIEYDIRSRFMSIPQLKAEETSLRRRRASGLGSTGVALAIGAGATAVAGSVGTLAIAPTVLSAKRVEMAQLKLNALRHHFGARGMEATAFEAGDLFRGGVGAVMRELTAGVIDTEITDLKQAHFNTDLTDVSANPPSPWIRRSTIQTLSSMA